MSDADVETGGGEDGTRDFTTVTTQSYGSKLKDSCAGMCGGFILFFVSIAILIWNEGRTVKRAKDIDEGQSNYLELDLSQYATVDSIPTTFENQLIHAVGDLSTVDTVSDPIFGVGGSDNSTADLPLKLSRSVEMYQWVETSTKKEIKQSNGSTRTETTYSYRMSWSSSLVDSSRFNERTDPSTGVSRDNPSAFPFSTFSDVADPILLENLLDLSDAVLSYINWFAPVSNVDINDVPDASLRQNLTTLGNGDGFYYGTTSQSSNNNPQVGDTRITFAEVATDMISVVALLERDGGNNAFELDNYMTESGGKLLLFKRGNVTAEDMFLQAEADNTTLAWILRFVGFILMVVSVTLVLQPIATAVDIIPCVGDCMQGGMENCIFPLIGVIIAIPTTLFVVMLAWLAYRPYIAVPIVAVSLGAMICLCCRAHQVHQASTGSGDKPPSSDGDAAYNTNDFNSNYNQNNGGNASSYETSNEPAYSANTGVGGGGGFANALDNPPPTAAYASNSAPYVPGKVAEPEIRF